jgi:ribosomal protein S18 acetylase RimI-like enzyme
MIRPAQPQDLPQLARQVAELAAHHDDQATVSQATLARDLFGPHPWLQILVSEADAQLQGYLALTQLARLQWGQRGMDIHHLYVAEPYRRLGLGRALIGAAVQTARAQDCSYLTVTALETNVAAQDFYRHQGFHHAPPSGMRFAFDLTSAPDLTSAL